MSFFGMGRPKPTSDEKIAMAEQEMRLLADMHNRYAQRSPCYGLFPRSSFTAES